MFVPYSARHIRDVMKEVLDTYHALGAEHFKECPLASGTGDAELALSADMDKLKSPRQWK